MTSAPWYLNKDHPTLQHQRNWNQKQEDTKWYDRGAKVFQATKYRKGACEKWVLAAIQLLWGAGCTSTVAISVGSLRLSLLGLRAAAGPHQDPS